MTPKINFHELAKLSPEQRAKLQQRTETDLSAFESKVRPIIAAVRAEGDEALARFARDFDKAPVKASEIAATEADFDASEKTLDPKVREAMEFAAHSIRKFHQDQMPEEMWLHEIRPGAFAGDRTQAHSICRLLHTPRQGSVSFRGVDDFNSGQSGWRQGCRHHYAAWRQRKDR